MSSTMAQASRPDDIGQVWERGFTRRGDDGGSGLGLHVVKTAVQEAGGDVRVWSRPFVATTFRLRIPAEFGSTEERSTTMNIFG